MEGICENGDVVDFNGGLIKGEMMKKLFLTLMALSSVQFALDARDPRALTKTKLCGVVIMNKSKPQGMINVMHDVSLKMAMAADKKGSKYKGVQNLFSYLYSATGSAENKSYEKKIANLSLSDLVLPSLIPACKDSIVSPLCDAMGAKVGKDVCALPDSMEVVVDRFISQMSCPGYWINEFPDIIIRAMDTKNKAAATALTKVVKVVRENSKIKPLLTALLEETLSKMPKYEYDKTTAKITINKDETFFDKGKYDSETCKPIADLVDWAAEAEEYGITVEELKEMYGIA